MSDTIVIDGDVSLDIPVDGEAESVIKVGHEIVTRTLTVAENGHYEPDFGVDGFSRVFVNVPKPPWSWMGEEVEHLSDLDYQEYFTLADTTFPSWTPSTSYTTVKDTSQIFSFTSDMANYDYVIVFFMEFDPVYEENAEKRFMIKRQVGEITYLLSRRPNSILNVQNHKFNFNIAAAQPVSTMFSYYNSSGSEELSVGNYGIYMYSSNPTFGGAIADFPEITVRSPSIRTVCNSSYFSQTSAGLIIPNQSIVKLNCEVYRVQKPNMQGWIYQKLVDVYNNGL